MEISWWRDLVIVIWGLVATVAVVIMTIIAYLFYKKVSTLLDSADYAVAKASDILDYAEQEVLQPVIQLGTILQGVVQGVSFFSNIFRKKEGKDE
jgi:hypothetical protein